VNKNFMPLDMPARFAGPIGNTRFRFDLSMKRRGFLLAIGAGILVLAGRSVTVVVAESAPQGSGPTGMVWERHGDWHLNGSSDTLRLGEAVPPGGLITAGAQGASHSMTILLPDGQRLLCECFETRTCSQGFRVPAINPPPKPVVWDMFVAVRNVLLLRPAAAETPFPIPVGRAEMAGHFEIVAPLTPQGEISISPALRVLPPGRYSLSVMNGEQQPAASTNPTVQPLDWNSRQPGAQVRVGGVGLYHIRVTDQSYIPRIEVEVLATSPASYPAEAAALKQTRETILNWNHTHEGWPLHPFLRVYLESRATALFH
jgi:hypothetical protein